jgi:ribulose 1,5-bisphosphate synthetase/thiazole synthase
MIDVPSLWAATAPPARITPPLRESGKYDVVIVGAGYTGLSACACWRRVSRAGALRGAMADRSTRP